jgi:hypothetical protein
MNLPDTLYHYTSQEGLIGIASTRTIWATNIRYLNDAKEFEYAICLLYEVLNKLSERLQVSKIYYSTLDIIRHLVDEVGNVDFQVNVSSFSEDGNSLSQWRAYCPSAAGFSVGFDMMRLKSLGKSQGFKLAKCSYDEKHQFLVLNSLINYLNDTLRYNYEKGMKINGIITQKKAHDIE